jgi:hypothetical protein
MPEIQFGNKQESESIKQPGTATLKGDAARIASNIALADQLGKFVAGEIMHQYQNENLAEQLNKVGQVAITISWG